MTINLCRTYLLCGNKAPVLTQGHKVEQYHNSEDWITFASVGTIYENAYEELEKRVKYTGVIANCVMLDDKWSRNMMLCISRT